jgi:protein tyrosine/serine phosphatase
MLSCVYPAFSAGQEDLPAFHQVGKGIVRSGQPTFAGLKSLSEKGYKTVVDLNMDIASVQEETQWAQELGMKFVSIPMDNLYAPSHTAVQTLIGILKEAPNHPVLVHDYNGCDSTGAMIAFYRMQEQNWPADKAYDEMLKYGFHPMFLALTDAVRDFRQDNELTGLATSQIPIKERANKKLDRMQDHNNKIRLGSRANLNPM